MTALDTTWHPEHFACASCGAAFGEEGYHVKDGKAYCRWVSLHCVNPQIFLPVVIQ